LSTDNAAKFTSIETVRSGFSETGYVCTREIATVLYLAYHLGKPVLIEGPAGVGKTELAKSMARYAEVPLIRLQCYEGLDESKALYEWKYGKQLLYTQILKDRVADLLRDTDSMASTGCIGTSQRAAGRLHPAGAATVVGGLLLPG